MISSRIDATTLTSYLEQRIEGFSGPCSVRKFADGQSNPTYLVQTQTEKYVLRKKPPGELIQSAHAVDREYRVLKALENTEVPVARALHLCRDDRIIGSMFYVMSFAEGRIFWDPALPELSKDERKDIYMEQIAVLAALHNIDIDKVGLADFGKREDYYERQIRCWIKQYRATETQTLDAMETLIKWLPENMPQDDGQVSLVHGDYKVDNLMFHPTKARISAILDWELSTLGHPIADLAYLCMCLHIPRTGHFKGLGGLDREELGIPSEQEMIDEYCRLRRISKVENWTFCLVFSCFRAAAILQGVFKRALDGNAANDMALEVGRQASTLAEIAVALIEDEARRS